MRRRHMLGLAAAALAARPAFAASPLCLLAAGPPDDTIDRWADASALALSPGFPGSPPFSVRPVGGLDGVTGANKFDALVAPDGHTAGMFPGAALLAWLAGDSRVQFDPTRWPPVMGASGSGILVMRGPAPANPAALAARAPLKLAADRPQTPDLAAMLALACMDIPTNPIFGLYGAPAKTAAFCEGAVDAVFLCGEGVPEDLAPLSANGGVPVFSLGRMGDDGKLTADPQFPTVPDAVRFGGITPDMPFAAAFAAAAAAARLDFFMVLPHLTDPAEVALWQQAGIQSIAAPALGDAAMASAISLRAAPGIAAELATLEIAPAETQSLQALLQARYGWRAG